MKFRPLRREGGISCVQLGKVNGIPCSVFENHPVGEPHPENAGVGVTFIHMAVMIPGGKDLPQGEDQLPVFLFQHMAQIFRQTVGKIALGAWSNATKLYWHATCTP